MFPSYPGSSPSSYRADDSFLQRAAASGFNSLSQAQRPLPPDEERGRASHSKTSSLRVPSHSSLSGRLSPTFEVEGSEDEDEDVDAAAAEEEDREPRQFRDREDDAEEEAATSSGTLSGSTALLIATETTPLISPAAGAPSATEGGRNSWKEEARIILGYCLPIAGTHFLEYSLLVVTVVSVGRIGTIELAAASLATMSSNVVALSVIQGFVTALDTLCPQAYTSNPRMTSTYAFRTLFILAILIVPQVIIFFNAESILLLLRQDPRVAERAALYLKVLSFGLPGYGGFEVTRRWLAAQGLMLAPVLALMVAAPLNVLLNYLLVWGPEPIRLGFIGAPISVAISMNAMCLVSVLYAVFAAPRDAWGGLSWSCVQNLGINIRLGLAGTLMIASEWWCWEIVGLASSFLGPTTLGAQSILVTSASLFYQIPYALSVAGAVRVGNLLGAQRPKRAQTACRVTMGVAVIVAGVNSLVLVTFRHKWGRLFSSDEDVIALVAGVLPLVALFQLTDGLSGATSGLMRGAGKATLGAIINLGSYYVFGLPIGLLLAFVGPKLGLYGLWIGLTVALTFTAVAMSFFMLRVDWEAECDATVERMGLIKRQGVEEP